jgi:hypothetical protein
MGYLLLYSILISRRPTTYREEPWGSHPWLPLFFIPEAAPRRQA